MNDDKEFKDVYNRLQKAHEQIAELKAELSLFSNKPDITHAEVIRTLIRQPNMWIPRHNDAMVFMSAVEKYADNLEQIDG